MCTFDDSKLQVNSPHRDVPLGAPEQGPVTDRPLLRGAGGRAVGDHR
jgi:hypothetical protein